MIKLKNILNEYKVVDKPLTYIESNGNVVEYNIEKEDFNNVAYSNNNPKYKNMGYGWQRDMEDENYIKFDSKDEAYNFFNNQKMKERYLYYEKYKKYKELVDIKYKIEDNKPISAQDINNGSCFKFAKIISGKFEYKNFAFVFSEEDSEYVHVYIKLESNLFFDAYGFHTKKDIRQEYNIGNDFTLIDGNNDTLNYCLKLESALGTKEISMLSIKKILNEGIINQDRINLFIKDVEQELKTRISGRELLSDFYIGKIINEVLNRHFGRNKIVSQVNLHPQKMNFMGHPVSFEGGHINYGKKVYFDVIYVAGNRNELVDDKEQVDYFINYAIKDLLLLLQHELTHHMEGKVYLPKKNEFNAVEEKYYYNIREIQAYSIQTAKALYNINIKPEDLKINLKSTLSKAIRESDAFRGDLIKFYTKFDKPQARKFWKYVYLHLVELYKIK